MTDFSHLIASEAKPDRHVQAKFYLSDKAHKALTLASVDLKVSMSAMVDTMILQELPRYIPKRPEKVRPKRVVVKPRPLLDID